MNGKGIEALIVWVKLCNFNTNRVKCGTIEHFKKFSGCTQFLNTSSYFSEKVLCVTEPNEMVSSNFD